MMLNRLWMIGTVLACVAIVALGWVLGISPQLDEVNRNTSQRLSVEENNRVQESTLATMKKQFEGIDDLRDSLADLQDALPDSDELSKFIGELHSIEISSGALIGNISFGTPQVFSAPTAEGAATPVPGMLTDGRFVMIPITISAGGAPDSVMTFVSGLQSATRLFLVGGLDISTQDPIEADGDAPVGPQSTAIITGFSYVLLEQAPPAQAPPVETPPTAATE